MAERVLDHGEGTDLSVETVTCQPSGEQEAASVHFNEYYKESIIQLILYDDKQFGVGYSSGSFFPWRAVAPHI